MVWAISPATNFAKAKHEQSLCLPCDAVVLVQITLSTGCKPQQKRLSYKRVAERLAEPLGVRPQDVLTNLVEVSWENWCFGNGAAHYMDA